MQMLRVCELTEHPQNSFFFDDISGDAWKEFLESVKTSGVIEPIVVDPDKRIISGHQRVRACKELGIETICGNVMAKPNPDRWSVEDEYLKQLIETNLRQRGIGNINSVKFGRCLKELERIYGIQRGGDRKSNPQNADLKTEKDLASQFGLSVDTLSRYKQLADMIPELQDLIQDGKLSPTLARKIVAQLDEEEQRKLAEKYGGGKIVQDQLRQFTQEIAQLKAEKKDLESQKVKDLRWQSDLTQKISQLTEEKDELEKKLQKQREALEKAAQSQKEVIKEVKVEVPPEDYDKIKQQAKKVGEFKKEYDSLMNDYNKKVKELSELKETLKKINDTSEEGKYKKKLLDSCLVFCANVNNFIERNAGLIWLTDHINELPELERTGYVRAIGAIKSWADQMEYNMNNTTKEIK